MTDIKRIFVLGIATLLLLTACSAPKKTNDSATDPMFGDSGFNSIGGQESEGVQESKDLGSLNAAIAATDALTEFSAACQTTLSLSVEGTSVELSRSVLSAFSDSKGNSLLSSDTDIKDEHNRFTSQNSLKRYAESETGKTFVFQTVTDLSGANSSSNILKQQKYKALRLNEFYSHTAFSDGDIANAATTEKGDTGIYTLTFSDSAAKRMSEALLNGFGVDFESSALSVSHFEIMVNINSGLMTERMLSAICTLSGNKAKTYSISSQFSLKSNRTSELSRPDWAK